MLIRVSRVDERKFLQINDEMIEVKDYQIKSSADGSTEISVVIEGKTGEFDLAANLKE